MRCYIMEVLLKGKAEYSWPPCTNLFRLDPFYIENIIYLFYKTSYLNEEVKCTEPSPLDQYSLVTSTILSWKIWYWHQGPVQ